MTLTLEQIQRALKAWSPKDDTILMRPERAELHYWVGCGSALVERDRVLLTYRRRRPRGTEPERGWQIGIAEVDPSLDPRTVHELVTIHKAEIGTSSMPGLTAPTTFGSTDWRYDRYAFN